VIEWVSVCLVDAFVYGNDFAVLLNASRLIWWTIVVDMPVLSMFV